MNRKTQYEVPQPSPGRPAIHWLAIEQVRPYEDNPRLCPARAIETVARSIKENGFLSPIITDEHLVILAGHTRLRAAQSLGLRTVPVIIAAGLSPEKARAYRLMDNRSHELTEWDFGLLASELAALVSSGIDPALSGFSDAELGRLLSRTGGLGLCDPDQTVEPPQVPQSKPGDLYLLGEQRLLCGDATDEDDVRRLMGSERASLMFTDPPYCINYSGGCHPQSWGNGGKQAGRDVASKDWDGRYLDGEAAVGFYGAFLRAALTFALSPAAAIYQCYAILRSEFIWEAWRQAGLLAHQVVIWRKSRAVLTHSWFLWDYEPIMVGWPAGHRPKAKPPADVRAVWEIASTAGNEAAIDCHPTVKPTALLAGPIGWHTEPGGLLYEPFCGSGTALIAAEMGRPALLRLELSPAFIDAARLRWERFTGRTAILEGR